MNKIKLELLAGAKDKECAKTAILAGADAIYIGANAFGARKNASNPLEDIKEIIDFAHLFNAKIYITLNTIIYQNELNSLQELVYNLYKLKADAIIFQDFAFLNLEIPPIELHASTQCHNINLEKIQFLEKCNVKRVVLPREFSFSQIKEIKKQTNIELETFCHGALCVSYSGQCYLSDYIGKRSANRGECAQPCRKKYNLIDQNGKIYTKNQHLLCLKDFNLSNKIEELISAGATSFKIEGRLKDVNYVKNTVLGYSKLLNDFISKNPQYERASKNVPQYDFATDLNKTFNRGYSEYFTSGKANNITSFDTPKHKGEFIGTVTKINKNEIEISTKKELNPQDGITFFCKNELSGTKIISQNGRFYRVLSSKGIEVGTKIFKNYDHNYISKLEHLELERKIPVSFNIEMSKNIEISAISEDFEIKETILNTYEKAQNEQNAIENIKKQFSKLGNTNFKLKDITINAKTLPHIKLSELNAIRTSIISKLENKILENYTPNKRETKFEIPQFPQKELDSSFNVANDISEDFYKKAGAITKEYAPEITNKYNKLMTTKHCLKREFQLCAKDVGNLFLEDEFKNKYPLKFDCKNCQMEIYAPNHKSSGK